MIPRTSRRNGCCSNQRSFHQLLKVVGENGSEWRAIVRKEHLGGTKRLKKLFEQRKMFSRALLQERSLSDMQFWYTEARKAASLAEKKNPKRSYGKSLVVGFILTIFFSKKSILANHRRLRGKRSSVTYSIKDSSEAASGILTNENEILSRWRKYFKNLLNSVKASIRDTQEVEEEEISGKRKFSLQQKWQRQLQV